MLLETLDIKKNDVIIYSQNLFNLEKNFEIIFKDDPQKRPHKISFSDVCRYINEFTPKNLIVYRLLTNMRNFEIYSPRYGFFVNINDVTELIYFDPIFAVKEIEEYGASGNFHDLRFRIQQVGLTTLNRKEDLPNYAEIYSVDLLANETKFQNDKVFADALFAFTEDDEKAVEKIKEKATPAPAPKIIEKAPPKRFEEKLISKKIVNEKHPAKTNEIKQAEHVQVNPLPKVKADEQHKDGIRIISHDVSEDEDFDYKKIMRINFRGATSVSESATPANKGAKNMTPEAPKQSVQNPKGKSEFGKFLEKSQNIPRGKNQTGASAGSKSSEVLDIFKSAASLNNFLKERENKQVVLKLNRK